MALVIVADPIHPCWPPATLGLAPGRTDSAPAAWEDAARGWNTRSHHGPPPAPTTPERSGSASATPGRPTFAETRTGGFSRRSQPLAACSTDSSARMHPGIDGERSENAEGLERNRYYDPSIGRYLQPEPMLAGSAEYWFSNRVLNRFPEAYAYVSNSPLVLTDPTGLQTKPCVKVEWAAQASSMGAGGGGAVCTCYIRKTEPKAEGCWSFTHDTTNCTDLATKGCDKHCEDDFNDRENKCPDPFAPASCGNGPGGPWGAGPSDKCPSGLTWHKGNVKCPP